MNEIVISNGHSTTDPSNLTIKMMGGNPSIGFIWIDNVQYTITKNQKGKVDLKKTK